MKHRARSEPRRTPLVLLPMLLPAAALAEGHAAPLAIELDAITVTGEGLRRTDMPTTVNVVGAREFEDRRLPRTEDILLLVPGVDIGNFGQGGVVNNIRMRGFGSGGHGGDVAIFIDGIPLNEGMSHADGYADLNVLIPLEIERLEVFKGPSSVLFGNFARGGTLAFYTKQRGDYRQLEASYGTFNTWDLQGAFGIDLGGGFHNNTAFQGARTDGFQDNSDWSRINASTRFTWDVNPDLDLAIGLRAHDSDWDAPGYIPRAQFDARSRRQAPNAENDGGNKTFYTQRVDLGWTIDPRARLLWWAYATQQDFTRWAKFGYEPGGQREEDHGRGVWGTGASLNLNLLAAERPLAAVLGIEYYHERTDWRRWDTDNRVREALRFDRRYIIDTLSLFGEVQWELSRWFRPTLGLRYDDFGGSERNRDPDGIPFRRGMNDYANWSPKVGFRSLVLPGLDLRASYSEGFALPRGDAKYRPELNVDPERIQQYEVGLTWDYRQWVWADLAGFILDTRDEIREDPPGSGRFRNLGKTRRTGLEAELRVTPIADLEFFAQGTVIDTEIRSNPNPALRGRQINGIPNHLLNLGVQYDPPRGVGARAKWRQVGRYQIDPLNTQSYNGYETLDLSLFYRHQLGGDRGGSLRLALDVLNALDEWYAPTAFSGFDTVNYAVGWPRTWWLAMNLDW